MPVTIVTPFPPSDLGWGQLIGWSTSFVGPLPSGSFLSVSLTRDSEGTEVISNSSFQTTAHQGQFTVGLPIGTWTTGSWALAPGQPVFVQFQLHDNPTGPVIDSGTQQMTWQPSSNAPLLIQEPTSGGGGGLTPSEALQLQQTQEATWPEHLVDQLTLINLGTGSATLPINANLTSPVFAVIVRLTAIPQELQPQTPDGDYWVPTLATVRIYRGSDLWIRAPIHTSSKIVNLWIEGLALGLADAVLSAGWLLNLTLQTSFLPGVEGQVYLMRVP